jgi:pimeloyl-ACP methyl ester carboxylesterase
MAQTWPHLNDDVDEHTIKLGELAVHYWEKGTGQPLILLHGGTATAEMSWATPMRLIRGGYRIVAPDNRGHGGTNNPDDGLAYDQMADDLAQLIDAIGLVQPLLFGHSDGAQIALEFGLRHPGVARALVLSGTMSEPTESYIEGLHQWGFTAPGLADVERIEAEFGDDYEPTRVAHEISGRPEHWPRFLGQIAELWLTLPTYTAEQLARIREPTLVITGDRDELADVDQALRLFRGIPRAELAVVPDGGHGAADQPLFWHVVMDFLERRR